MAVGTHSWLICLCESEKRGTVYKARLNNPVQDIQKISWMCQGRPNLLQKWLDILLWNSFGFDLPNRKEVQSKICYWKDSIKKDTYWKIEMVNLSVDGTVASGKDRLLKYQKNIMKNYQ